MKINLEQCYSHKLKQELENYEDVFSDALKEIERVSNDIRLLETYLSQSCLVKPFVYEELGLAWSVHESSGDYRLMYNGKPLIQGKVKERISVHPHLWKFVKALGEYLENCNESHEK